MHPGRAAVVEPATTSRERIDVYSILDEGRFFCLFSSAVTGAETRLGDSLEQPNPDKSEIRMSRRRILLILSQSAIHHRLTSL